MRQWQIQEAKLGLWFSVWDLNHYAIGVLLREQTERQVLKQLPGSQATRPRIGSQEILVVAFYYWSLDEVILNIVHIWRYWHSPKPTSYPKGLAHVFALFGSRYILGISEQKWTGMGERNSDDHYIYYCGQESLRRNGVAIMVNKNLKCSTWMQCRKKT